MPQQTNLNVAPYFDDFDASNDFHKVLFKPGYAVQARELTSLQSILQNQIERFGQHFFKEGEKVIPGNTAYNRIYNCVQLVNTFQGVPVSAYAEQLEGTKITGLTSGVTAYIDSVLLPEDSERGNLTLYVNYLNSSTANNSTEVFSDAEELACNEIISSGLLGNSTISAGAPFGATISNEAAQIGSSFHIQDGIYFIRGNFVNVDSETLILDQYGTTPSYRVGLFVNEEIITADLDETLNDNSQGFNNYAAPGADRLKISTSLLKKSLDDLDDGSFVELGVVVNGVLRTKTKKTGFGGGVGYNDITDILARRTFAESGDYYVTPFDITMKESLNNSRGNGGVYNAGQFTYGGSAPSDDLALYRVSAGRAFVRGYDIETINSTYLDVDKPRTTKLIEDQSIIYNTGPTLKLDNVNRTPSVGIGSTYVLSLRDERIGPNVDANGAPGNEIGLARVFDFRIESGAYDSANANLNQWGISLYDVQSFTTLTLNQATSLSIPTFVKGQRSGATAFIRSAVSNSKTVTLYETKGEFISNEPLFFDGILNGRTSIAATAHGIGDVKSVFGSTDGITGIHTFSADTIQSVSFNVGVATITPRDQGGISTVRSTNPLFPGTALKLGSLIQYSDLAAVVGDDQDPVLGRVVSVGSSHVNFVGVTTVTGIVGGKLPNVVTNVTDLKVLTTPLDPSTDNSLFTSLPKDNIESLNLTDAILTIRKTLTVNIVNNKLSSTITAEDNEVFLPFTPTRYSLIREDGTTEELTADKFTITSPGGKSTLQINGLGTNTDGSTLIATLRKRKPKAKVKVRNRVQSIIIDKSKNVGSGIGTTTLNDGLTYGNYPFGTRVQDETISLNTPDIIEVHGVFESTDTSTPSSPTLTLQSIISASSTIDEFTIGESIVGQNSGAVAIISEKTSIADSKISVLYKNDILFGEGETIISSETNVSAIVNAADASSFDVSTNFIFNNGQEQTFYDYGVIKRKFDSSEPSKKLRVYFKSASYESTDDGDITTIGSYDNFDYSSEIGVIGGFRNSDIIDIRPRVSSIASVSEGDRSPLEFLGRVFTGSGDSAKNILASDESLFIDFSYYQGRIDRIFLTKDGKFQVKYGVPSDRPEPPLVVDDAIEICSITLPPFLYNTGQAALKFNTHKRYRMQDIHKLENRIKNLEYYTSLSMLEINTANLFVSDADGLNRFKSGFFVDNFTSFKSQEEGLPIKNSIDAVNKEFRPTHYTNSVDLIQGPVVNNDTTADLNFTAIEGNNVRKQNGVITLDYAEVEWLKQSFATRTESVTPFLISFWKGSMELTPASDTWIDTARMKAKVIDVEGDFSSTLELLARTENVDRQTGMAPIVWNAWETNWTGSTITQTTQRRETTSGSEVNDFSNRRTIFTATRSVIEDTLQTSVQTGVESRSGNRTIISEQFDRQSVGDRSVSRDIIPFMRSRNIEFVSKRMKPLTRMYAFFDGEDVTRFCVPKLLEISMVSGTFTVGETITGRINRTGLDQDTGNTQANITFRVAQSNHREGPYDVPTATFTEDPYNNTPLSGSYSSTSEILNVDTFSLSAEAQGEFFGFVAPGMVLTGGSSGAQATIKDVRLLSDLAANLTGSFFIPDPNSITFPEFETGTKSFTLINDPDNNQDLCNTIAEEAFTSAGTLETVQENILSIRNARIERRQEFTERSVSRDLGTQVVSSAVISNTVTFQSITGWGDPLAQSFQVEDDTGIFLTKCDIFFASKDDMDIPVVIQLRTMENGTPTQKIIPFSEIVIAPEDVTTSADGSVATSIEFKTPVYLEGGNTAYSICLLSNSTKYSVYISRIGENDLLSGTFISNQPYLGSLFKSQNASTWEPSQWEDLKFTLYRADFIESGSVEFYSPELTKGNGMIPRLMPDSLILNSKKIRVGLGTTTGDTGYQVGNTFFQLGTQASGDLVGVAAKATTIVVSNPGIGYTPSTGSRSFNSVNLVTLSGNGRGAVADVFVNAGVIGVATITNGGSGYQVGDVVGISTIGIATVGRNSRLTITGIGMTSELIFENVQGEFVTGIGNTLMYVNSAGITTQFNFKDAVGVGNTISNIIVDTDGLHIKVNHKNHGMYFSDNRVAISDVQPDIKPTKLSAEFSLGSTGEISVNSGTNFDTFENVGVGTTNVGFLKIGNEIIEYTNVTGNVIGGTITRGNNQSNYPIGTPVFKYELGGVNLHRVNKTHNLNDVTVNNPITFDSYNVKLDMSETFNTGTGTSADDRSNDVGLPKLFMNKTKNAGGYDIRASQNMPFEILTPIIQNVTVRGTSLNAEVRTISSQSISGNEIPFIDEGFTDLNINTPNYFDSTRMISSKVNETAKLDNIPGNKSLNMRMFLGTVDTRVSPVIDSQRVSIITTSNRVNSVVTNYATDSRVNTLREDPTACQYISKEIVLENPASSLKILVSAHVNTLSDIRALYAISEKQGFDPIFQLFPGYDNLNTRGQVIDSSLSDGQSDAKIIRSDNYNFDSLNLDYKEMTFTIDQLPAFRSYRIKLLLTSTSQVYVPRVRDLRVIALA